MKFKDNITGVLCVNKKEGLTSRDVVNQIQKLLNTKAGHTGTLDPLATGVLVITLGKATKLSEIITSQEKEYEAEMIFGLETDTLDIEGETLNNQEALLNKEEVVKVLENFKGTYNQEVPKYSAVKIKGKKLYEYAREKIDITLPKREVNIFDIKLLDFYQKENKTYLKFYTKVSKGTYIRSLIRDIAKQLNTFGTMTKLKRISQGKFTIDKSYTLEDIKKGNYHIIKIKDALDIKIKKVDENDKKKILNGVPFESNEKLVLFTDKDDNDLAIYKNKDNKLKMYKMLYQPKH